MKKNSKQTFKNYFLPSLQNEKSEIETAVPIFFERVEVCDWVEFFGSDSKCITCEHIWLDTPVTYMDPLLVMFFFV